MTASGQTRFMSACLTRRRQFSLFGGAAQDGDTIVTDVMLTRLIGVALMNSPLMTTV